MRAVTHISFGLLSLGLLSGVTHLSFSLGNIISASIASILPDIDTTQSTIGKVFLPISKFLDSRFGHRTITHSLIGYALLAILFTPLLLIKPAWYFAALIGYFSHLVIDCINKVGVPFLWPNNTYYVFPGLSKWRIQVGTTAEYITCGFIILIATGIWYVNGLGGIRTWASSLLASPQMAVSEYRANADSFRMKAKISGFYTLTQKPINKETFEVIDALDDSTLLLKDKQGYLVTASNHPTDTIQVKRVVIEKVHPMKVKSDNFIFDGQSIKDMLPYLNKDTYVSGSVEAFTRPKYVKMDMPHFRNGEFESIKVSPGLSEFEAKIEFRNASFKQLKKLANAPISGELVSRRVD